MFTLSDYLSACVVLVVTYVAYCYYKNVYRIQRYCSRYPCPPTEPFFGNTRAFTTPSLMMTNFIKYTKEYGNIVHLQMGPFGHVLVISDYDFIHFILNNHKLFHKSLNMRFLDPWIGKGLLLLKDEVWRKHRKLITPAFHFKILEKFIETFESASDLLVKKLSDVNDKKILDIHQFISRCTLDIICETAMGTKTDAQNTEKSDYFNSVKEMCRIFIVRTMSPLRRSDLIFYFTKDYEIQKKALKFINDETDKVIEMKIRERQTKTKPQTEESDEKKKKVFIDIMLESSVDGQVLSEEELRDEINTFMFGGHDTTAAASSFVFYCLANNKEVQDKVLEEQRQIFGNKKHPEVTYSHLQEMKYLESVIKESMRLYSPVPLFGRITTQDVVYAGATIPKGVSIIIFSQGLHLNPEYFPDPEKFDPSRFETRDGKQPFTYIPFGAGPRNCIGQKYAMLELKCLVSKIIRIFELIPATPHHEMELSAETVLKSLNGVKVGLKIRN